MYCQSTNIHTHIHTYSRLPGLCGLKRRGRGARAPASKHQQMGPRAHTERLGAGTKVRIKQCNADSGVVGCETDTEETSKGPEEERDTERLTRGRSPQGSLPAGLAHRCQPTYVSSARTPS